MNNSLAWGEFDLDFLIGELNHYFPRKIEFCEVLIEREVEQCISLDDIEMICRTILRAFGDGIEIERLRPMVPRARMMLDGIERMEERDE
jgi:hypothetical protein